jgi:serine/threonine protein kinase
MLCHPNVVDILYVCWEPDDPLIVMEYMAMSLWEALHDRMVQMTDKVKLDLMVQMWRGLAYVHKMNVAHCDVKSENILLGRDEKGRLNFMPVKTLKTCCLILLPVRVLVFPGLVAKLTDFGNAIFQSPFQDGELHFPEAFSVRYAAPEILSVTPRNVTGLKAADAYSMAVTCFEVSFRRTM